MPLPPTLARVLGLAALLACARPPPPPAPRVADPVPAAAWHRGAVVYGVVPPLLVSRPGESPLAAVTAHLDALADLGVDVLWLAPVTATDDPGAISYAVTDLFALRPDYGTPAELRALVREAHARRMRVVLDLVASHTSTGHPFYRDAEARGRASPWWAFYERGPDGEARYDFDWKHLRRLDYANPAVRRMVSDACALWVRDYDVDGFRFDAAWAVKDRAADFWPALVKDLRAQKPGLLLLAEASARDPYWIASGFDAAYDWTAELGHGAWEHAFDDPRRVAPALDAALAARATPMDRVLRFLGNNDTGARFVTRHGPALTRVAAVLEHTLPGLPLVFTGEETGAAYEPYADPAPLDGRDPSGLRPLYRRLAALREQLPALRDGLYRRARVTEGGAPSEAVFAFQRDAGEAGRALVVLNFGPAPARVELEIPGAPGPAPAFDALAERAEPARAVDARTVALELPPTSARVLVDGPPLTPGVGRWRAPPRAGVEGLPATPRTRAPAGPGSPRRAPPRAAPRPRARSRGSARAGTGAWCGRAPRSSGSSATSSAA
ncbi:MAG: alpha-amylase family glycosyl hydrolase [Anaeromyxobacteraceae bacterium]